MSNKILALAIAAIFVLAGCQREDGEVVFEASFANDNNAAKIAMTPAGMLSWEAGDLVRVSDRVRSGTIFEVHYDNHNNVAHLHQADEIDDLHTYFNSENFYAIYPGNRNTNINNELKLISGSVYFKIISLSDKQTVTDDRHYDKDWLVCTASNIGSSRPTSGTRTVSLVFHNCMSLLKCSIDEGCNNICQLKVTADNTGTQLGGHGWVSTSDASVNLDFDIDQPQKKYDVVLKKQDNTPLASGDYYIAIWPDYIKNGVNTTKTNVTITPCDASGEAINGYGSYTVASYSFARNTIYPVGTFPKTSNSAKNASIFH